MQATLLHLESSLFDEAYYHKPFEPSFSEYWWMMLPPFVCKITTRNLS